MPLSPADLELAKSATGADGLVCRKCYATNPKKAASCRKCKSTDLRPKKQAKGKGKA